MSVRNHRPAVVGVIAATAIAVPIAALASDSNSPSPSKPAHSQVADRSAAEAAKSAAAADSGKAGKAAQVVPGLHSLASSAGISVSSLQAGLMAVKRAGGDSAAGIAAFASSAGVSNATARRIVHAVFGSQHDRSITGPAAVGVLASRLGVSRSTAQHAMQRIGALSGRSGIDPASPAFAAIAHDLGVSPAKLAAALDAVKQSIANN